MVTIYPKRIEQTENGYIVSDADNAHANKKVHLTIDSALQDLRERFENESRSIR